MTNAETKERRNIAIDGEFRLVFDTENVMIERLVTVDPTRAPHFDPAKHDATIRQEWRNVGKYYATIPRALTGLLEYKIRTGDAATLREILDEIRAFKATVDALLSAEV